MTRLALLIILVLASGADIASAEEYLVKRGGENRVVFTSKAPMETFKGKTDQVEGRIELNPQEPADSATVHIEVDLASLDTGNEKRNRHMRENHLETDKYPLAVFDGFITRGGAELTFESGVIKTVDVEGTFTVHGVSRRLRTTIDYRYSANGDRGEIWFRTEFEVSLAEYEISRPQFLFMKLADEQLVEVQGTAFEAKKESSATETDGG